MMSHKRDGLRWIGFSVLLSIVIGLNAFASGLNSEGNIVGELRKWHRVTLTFDGPSASEDSEVNPFLDYRLIVTFIKGPREFQVPGFFAADGDAANSGAKSGNKWRVRFTPDEEGFWRYEVSFRKGERIAISDDPDAGEPVDFDGARGVIRIGASDKGGRDFRGKGFLQYDGSRYLRFAEHNEYFIKGGADSPENFLAYADFDDTFRFARQSRDSEAKPNLKVHAYEPHLADWREGDPVWKGGKGKSIIGALNYLSDQGMNSVYFLTMNVQGDGNDVWPWTAHDERFRFDCSKLDQWEIVFSHMDALGLMMHVITQETENDQLLDGGDLGAERKLYYRELIARFAHHPALVWNFGEENTNTTAQLKAFGEYFDSHDPYKHPRVVHTFPGKYDEVYSPLLGSGAVQGLSLQMGDQTKTHSETLKWVLRSREIDSPWFVCLDEIGPADTGVKPDADDPAHDGVRRYSLWGNLMAGGDGCEWYFGYKFAHNDLNCEDWRSRQAMWDQTRIALWFFNEYIPFAEMLPADDLSSDPDDYVFAKAGEVYALYSPAAGKPSLSLEEGDYSVSWYNPRTEGGLLQGGVKTVSGPGEQSLGEPPSDPGRDWVILVKKQ
ncbi:MAG: DUF5060 domain-containing protein [bacterium]|nr:DUF5060 domain-containing protein [bacterium]